MGRTNGATGSRVGGWTGAIAALCLLAMLVPGPAGAQAVPKSLTLQDAIDLAERNNPGFLSTKNDQGPADWGARAAYAHLLPSVDASGQTYYIGSGPQRFGSVIFGAQATDWLGSNYGLSLNWQLSGQTLFGLASARANQRYTEANIDANRFALATQVAQQYVAALQAKDAVSVDERDVEYAEQSFKLAQTQVASGAKAGADAKQAEVQLGQARVALVQARRQAGDATAALAEQIGVPLPDSVALVSRFRVFDPSWSVDSLLSLALASHPAVRADEAKVSASVAQARQARSAYFPTLNASLNFSGYTQKALNPGYVLGEVAGDSLGYQSALQQCQMFNDISAGLSQPLPGYPQDCSQHVFTPAVRQQAFAYYSARNNAFPFNFTRNPLQLSVMVSIPVFSGFSRQKQVAEASAAVDDARQSMRQEKLTLGKELTQAYEALRADYQVVQIQKQNQEAAQQALEWRQRQYAAGVAQVTILNLLDAQKTLSTVEQGYLQAVYDFHYNLIRLEAAVGRPLTPDEPAGPGETGSAGGL